MNAVERRFTAVPVERRGDGGEPRIIGYAAKFNMLSQNLGGYVERIAPTFFNKSRGDGWPGVIARYNHDDNMLLGTSDSGTLRLTVDEVGLGYDVTPPSSRADVVELVGRGDVRQSSFAFRVMSSGGEEWDLSDTGYPRRTLVTGQLIDVAPVNTPAYVDTSAALRSLAAVKEAELDEVRDLAEHNELRKLFVVTTGEPVKPKRRVFGPAAAADLMARRSDPWE